MKRSVYARTCILTILAIINFGCYPPYQPPPPIPEQTPPPPKSQSQKPVSFNYLAYIEEFRSPYKGAKKGEVFIGNYTYEDYLKIGLKYKRISKQSLSAINGFRTRSIAFSKSTKSIIMLPANDAPQVTMSYVTFKYNYPDSLFNTASTTATESLNFSRELIYPVFAKKSEILNKIK